MLTARNAQGEMVMAWELTTRQQGVYTCPACHQSVVLKRGKVMQAHFAHKRLKDCRFFTENESDQHLSLKASLYKNLSEHGHTVHVERFLPSLGQVADVMVEDKLALEVQCSRLSKEQLRQRTQSYQHSGIEVRWLLGKGLWLGRVMSPLQRDFLYFSKNIGFHLWELDWEADVIRLKFLIYEDIFGKLHYQERTWSLAEDLLAVLRTPYQGGKMVSYTVVQRQKVAQLIQKQLLFQNKRWLKRQEEAYWMGRNLLTMSDTDFYHQVGWLGES